MNPNVSTDSPSVSRKSLLTALLEGTPAIATAEIKEVTLGPRAKAGLHLHPCHVVGVITAGAILFQIEGQPAQNLLPGDAFFEPANVRVARFDNAGESPAKFVAIYLLGAGEQELIRMLH